MNERGTIFNLLNNFTTKHKNISWEMKCLYSDGKGTTMNQIKIISLPQNNNIGIIVYQVETGIVSVCKYQKLIKGKSENIIDMLLDMINYSKGQIINS
ncbi:MAG: hypothetical protein COA88_05420 [Kordia sp.]|nr:MAG: hypothetical protein COA88_05420 [Kordia sp.]